MAGPGLDDQPILSLAELDADHGSQLFTARADRGATHQVIGPVFILTEIAAVGGVDAKAHPAQGVCRVAVVDRLEPHQ